MRRFLLEIRPFLPRPVAKHLVTLESLASDARLRMREHARDYEHLGPEYWETGEGKDLAEGSRASQLTFVAAFADSIESVIRDLAIPNPDEARRWQRRFSVLHYGEEMP